MCGMHVWYAEESSIKFLTGKRSTHTFIGTRQCWDENPVIGEGVSFELGTEADPILEPLRRVLKTKTLGIEL